MVSTILAENNVNILSINQNIMDGFFNMVMIAEMGEGKIKLQELQRILAQKGKEINLEIKAQHQEIFNVMHKI
jgi:ACT domain-containing protein